MAWPLNKIQHNLGLLKAGVGFREISEKSFGLPEPYYPNRYANVMHGVGLTDEWPVIVNRSDWDTRGYEGALEESMILSVESYVGATGGTDGVKRTARSSRAMDISSCPPSPTRNGWEVEYTQFYAGSFQNFALVMRRATASAAA